MPPFIIEPVTYVYAMQYIIAPVLHLIVDSAWQWKLLSDS